MEIVIATHNQGKLNDFRQILTPLSGGEITISALTDHHVTDQPDETAATFQDNALLKAKYYAEKLKVPIITDDGGLGIDALNGEPGVKSHRWPGHEARDEELIAYTLERMHDVPEGKRQATLGTCLCFYDPATGFTAFAEGAVNGHISETFNPNWTRGYPYRAVFIVDGYEKYYDELTPEEHEAINHRVKAIRELVGEIRKYMHGK